jgi:hypothetical protein
MRERELESGGGESTMRKRANAPLPGGRSFLQAAGELVDGA